VAERQSCSRLQEQGDATVPHIRRMQEQLRELSSEIAESKAHVRSFIAKSVEALKRTELDTFLGRKTQEPFPKEEEEG